MNKYVNFYETGVNTNAMITNTEYTPDYTD